MINCYLLIIISIKDELNKINHRNIKCGNNRLDKMNWRLREKTETLNSSKEFEMTAYLQLKKSHQYLSLI